MTKIGVIGEHVSSRILDEVRLNRMEVVDAKDLILYRNDELSGLEGILANNPPYLITKHPEIPIPEIFIKENKSPIPKREYNVYTQRKPKPVKRKKTPKSFGKNKRKK